MSSAPTRRRDATCSPRTCACSRTRSRARRSPAATGSSAGSCSAPSARARSCSHDTDDADFALLASDACRGSRPSFRALIDAGFAPSLRFPGADRPGDRVQLRSGTTEVRALRCSTSPATASLLAHLRPHATATGRCRTSARSPPSRWSEVALPRPHLAEGARRRRRADRAVRRLAHAAPRASTTWTADAIVERRPWDCSTYARWPEVFAVTGC